MQNNGAKSENIGIHNSTVCTNRDEAQTTFFFYVGSFHLLISDPIIVVNIFYALSKYVMLGRTIIFVFFEYFDNL